jgi:competence protein ComEC
MRRYGKNIWCSLPFLRLLLALIAGILLERYFFIPPAFALLTIVLALLFLAVRRRLSFAGKFALQWLTGSFLNLLMIGAGALLFYTHDHHPDANSLNKYLDQKQLMIITLQETPVERARSWKALAKLEAIRDGQQWINTKGKLYVYFKKDALPSSGYGAQLLVRAMIQPIANTGNPGAFDYRQYCLIQGIHAQTFLQASDWRLINNQGGNGFHRWLLQTRDHILAMLKKYVPGEKESGVAEALLIGYRDDLDKDLVRAYSNTGVVHIIAISGLHLGMIYGLLLLLLKPFRKTTWIRWLKPLLVLAVLWGFSLLTGAAASILRSAVMFSFIAIGESIGRRTITLNTLAASAFCLLLYDPYFLWDAGFQLSYTAVGSILLFQQPIYRQIYCRNKLLDSIWQLNSVSLAAQILTLPVILYYFHQFPNLFLFTNFIAVPLSGLILYAELLLLVCSSLPWLAGLCGNCISFLIRQMNGLIERTDRLPFAVTDGISMPLVPVFLLYLLITMIAVWLSRKNSKAFIGALFTATCLSLLLAIGGMRQNRQHRLLVYHVPKHRAIDLIEGDGYLFLGDGSLLRDPATCNFYLQPARIVYGVKEKALRQTFLKLPVIQSANRTVILVDKTLLLRPVQRKIPVDLVVISNGPRIHIPQLAAIFDCAQYVFDSSNPLWKIRQWKKQADSLHLRHHSVPEQGAFEMAL